MANRYIPDCEFIPNQPQLVIEPYCGHEGPHFLTKVEDAKQHFRKRWASSQLAHHRVFQADIPANHFQQPVTASLPLSSFLSKQNPKDRDSDPKGKKRARNQAPHFTAVKHMFELVGEGVPEKSSSIPRKFLKYAGRGTNIPLFSDGKLSYLCLGSSCQPPWNKCCTYPCENTKSRSGNRLEYTHPGLNEPYWRDLPEEKFSPVIAYLQLPGINASIRPSQYLKEKTPSANW
jgi:hypothetical protein